jgi:hypothetical protein
MLGSSRVAAQLAASQEGLSAMSEFTVLVSVFSADSSAYSVEKHYNFIARWICHQQSFCRHLS